MSFFSISSGKLIEYLDNGRFICGFVTESQSKRIRLLNQNGRELNLPISRVVHCSESSHPGGSDRENLVKLLQDTTQKRRLLMEDVDLEMLWELTSDETTDTFEPHFLAELSFGCSADDDIVSAFLRSVFHDKLFFKYREGKIKAHSPEQVEQLRLQQHKEAQKQQLAVTGISLITRINEQAAAAAPYSEDEEEIHTLVQNY
ncbi:MAG: ribonuclease R, partial [Desulfocapsaceae bacterium]|nr:ribonuclease R [Desulfocapsaceae bacterium]